MSERVTELARARSQTTRYACNNTLPTLKPCQVERTSCLEEELLQNQI